MSPSPEMPRVVVVGAGRAGLDVRLLEASDGVGGRVRTDVVDAFRARGSSAPSTPRHTAG